MTQERLRELLHERVADETMPDFSARAWQAARVVRRRRRLGAAAGLVAATVAVSAGIAAVDSTPPAHEKSSDRGVPDVGEPADAPDATYQGVPVWWSPDQHEEQDLPATDSPLPADIELGGRPSDPMDRALAAFAHGKSVTLVGPDGAMQWVDLSRLQDVVKPNGYAYFPTSTWMLTHDGTRLVFNQPKSRLQAVFTIATGVWSQDLVSETSLTPPTFDVGSAQHYGAIRGQASSWGMGVPLPLRDPGTDLADPDFLLVGAGEEQKVLAFTWLAGDGTNSRFKNCCPVAGWLDDDTVVYESRQTDPLLVAWHVATHDFRLVSRIHGAYDVASFAL